MKDFQKPTKFKWTLFIFLLLNLSLFLFGLLLWNFGIYQWSFFLIPLFQIGWLYSLFGNMGIPVASSREFIDTPNFLGWTLIVVGSFITLIIYYLLASAIVKYLSRTKEQK